MQSYLPALVRAVWQHRALILTAEPGSGKTTQVPWALSNAAGAPAGQILVLEPRRLAARMAAQYVAHTLGERVGQRIGFRVRHEDATSAQTRVVYMTEGLLWRTMLSAPSLAHVACVVFDEFHGRTLAGDLMLGALVHRRRRGEPTPAIVIMSATLAQDAVRDLLPDAAVMHVPGRQYPVSIDYVGQPSRDPLELQVARGVAQVLQRPVPGAQGPGHILTFLPGTADIERARRACQNLAKQHGLVVAPLHASLPPQEQDRAVAPGGPRRLILATNVAETSLTIDGVTHVIDSGLAKINDVDPLTGIGRLQTGAISQAAATQRAGRAGRTGPGFCLRLFTSVQFKRRPAFEVPEILRADLAEAVLWLGALQLPPPHQMPLLDVPTAEAVQQAEQTLARLGAWHQGAITPLGHRLLALAVHPRLARMVLGAHALGIGDLGCRAAAVLSLGPGAAKPSEGAHHVKHALGHSDLEPLCAPQALTFEAKRAHKSLLAALSALPRGPKVAPHTDAMALLEEALLLGFSDRLVRRLPPLGPKAGPLPVALGWGGKGTLSAHSCVRDNPLMLALAAGQRGERHGDVTVDIAHGVAPESLLALDDGRLQEGCDVMVSPQHGRVEKVETLSYDNLLIHELRSQQVTPDEAREALADWLNRHRAAVLQQRQAEPEYQQLLARLMAVAEQGDWGPLWGEPTAPNASSQAPSIPEQLQVALMQVLLQLSASCRSVAQLQAQPAAMVLAQSLAQPWQQALRQNAPLQVTLGSGRTVKVTYLEGQKPFIASYLQDFFGSTQGPTLGASRVPLTLHLLGPNRQPLQVTQDLANFWREHYPKLRPALARRYPRHLWPTDPLTATPPAPRKGRR